MKIKDVVHIVNYRSISDLPAHIDACSLEKILDAFQQRCSLSFDRGDCEKTVGFKTARGYHTATVPLDADVPNTEHVHRYRFRKDHLDIVLENYSRGGLFKIGRYFKAERGVACKITYDGPSELLVATKLIESIMDTVRSLYSPKPPLISKELEKTLEDITEVARRNQPQKR